MVLSNKTLINIIYLSVIVMIIGGIGMFILNDNLMIFLPVGFIVFMMTGMFLLIKNGEFINSDAYRYTGITIAFLIIGMMLNVMHWPGAALCNLVGLTSCPILYGYYLIRLNRHNNAVRFAY